MDNLVCDMEEQREKREDLVNRYLSGNKPKNCMFTIALVQDAAFQLIEQELLNYNLLYGVYPVDTT